MTDYKINLLERIFAGQYRFKALGESLADYGEFMQVANALIQLEQEDCIVIKHKRREKHTGQHFYYDFVVDQINQPGLAAIGKDQRATSRKKSGHPEVDT